MHRPDINLFQHPTTTVYIDDSTAFLYSITLGVDHQPFRSYSDPFACLDYVDQFSRQYEFNSIENQSEASTAQDSRLGQHFANLAKNKLHDSLRFAEPSVVVVDYSMPQLNGLDLCSRIQNPYVKKVLLTGVADEKIAINALNSQLIDFYVSKSESSLSQELNRIITHLRDRYFQDIYGWTKDIRLKGLFPYLYNSDFADFFEDVAEQLDIVEHYPIENPWGFVLISKEGKVFHLAVSDTDIKNHKNNKTNTEAIITSASVNDTKANSIIHCAVYAFENFYSLDKNSSFIKYLQGPGFSALTSANSSTNN